MPRAIRLSLEEWPPPDREAWVLATTASGYYDDCALAADWSAATKRQAQAAYGRWLAFVRSAHPAALQQPAAERFDRERVCRYIGLLAARISPMGVAAELGHLRLMLRVLSPETDWHWLLEFQNRFRRRAVPRDRRHKMVHPARLIELGKTLMNTAEAQTRKGEAARQYRDGLLIAFLATRPLRRRSLQEIDSKAHLRRVGVHYVLFLRESNTKTRVALEMPLPEWLSPYLSLYVERYRMQFPRADAQRALWLSSKGGPLSADAIYRMICRRTKTEFGEAIFPHLFRHIAATTIARDKPAAVGLASGVLTHANVETTLDYYTQANTLEAARKYQAAQAAIIDRASKSSHR